MRSALLAIGQIHGMERGITRGGGDKRTALQVGGTGEANLPRQGILTLTELETKQLLRNLENQVGDFEDGQIRKTLAIDSVYEFIRPFCPWAKKICCSVCGSKKVKPIDTAAGAGEAVPKAGQPNLSTNAKIVKPGTARPPRSQVVPRLQDFKDLDSVVGCWRSGLWISKKSNLTNRVTPLRMLIHAAMRKQVWKGYSDTWWKQSGNKLAFIRVKNVISVVIAHSSGSCTFQDTGNDACWSAAVQSVRAHNPLKTLSALAQKDALTKKS